MHNAVEFGSGLQARLAKQGREAFVVAACRPDRRLFESVDLRPFYELLTSEALIFRDFRPTAPRPRRGWLKRLR
jgi:hypothetical protein